MKLHLRTALLLGLLILTFACQTKDKPTCQLQTEVEKTNKSQAPQTKDFNVNPEAILEDFRTWWNYTYYNIHLAQDFIGLDTDSVAMSKADFLNQLETGI